jgi:hypothetical protein
LGDGVALARGPLVHAAELRPSRGDHRRKHDPLNRIPKVLVTGTERVDRRGSERTVLGLRIGDPNDELRGALS